MTPDAEDAAQIFEEQKPLPGQIRVLLPGRQRLLVAWFGIRGIGSLFYLAFAMEHGVSGTLAHELLATTLVCVALSIVLHGVSATPLMRAHENHGPTPEAPSRTG